MTPGDPRQQMAAGLVSGQLLHCLCGIASKKSFTIGTMTGMRFICVMCVVLGKMANLDAENGRTSPKTPAPRLRVTSNPVAGCECDQR
jgi:hypothetical protein